MHVLNLVRPEKSDIKFEIITFPDGEPHIRLEGIDRKDKVIVVCRITSPKDLFILLQTGDILNRHEVTFALHIYYLMSMRMDRVISFNEACSLKTVSDLINSMNPESVNVLEPHSHKTEALIKEFWGSLEPRIPDFTGYIPVYPDSGAVNRYQTLGEVLMCSKTCNPDTGKLEGFHIENPELLQDEDFKGFPLVVMDDLCDAGGTFTGIADKIREVDPDRKLAVYVTHMVNPKGITALSGNYDEVYFTNSYADWDEYMKLPDNVRIIKVI